MKKPDGSPGLPTYAEAWRTCRTQILVCVVLSLLLTITAAVIVHNKPLVGDEWVYDLIARDLLAGKGYWSGDYWLGDKSPGYSTFLAGAYVLGGGGPALARAVQLLLHTFTVALLVVLAYRFTRSQTVAWIAGLLACTDVYVSVYHVHLLSESIFDPVSFGMIVAFDDAFRGGKARSWLLGGLLFALSIYVRPSLCLLPVLLLLVAIVRRLPVRRLAVGFAAAGVAAAVVLLPWSVRNYKVFDAFTPLPAYGGTCLNLHVKNAIRRAEGKPIQVYCPSTSKRGMYKESAGQQKEALQLIVRNPAVFAVSIPMKSFQLWTSSEWTSPAKVKSKVLGLLRLFALVLALLGFFNRRLDGQFRLLAAVALGYTTLLIALSAHPEYRYAFWAYPMYYLLIAVSLYGLGVRTGLFRSQAGNHE